jgi:hypothetical protein
MLDWKNEEEYAYTEKLDGNGWAFEFLRRNRDYQDDHKQVINNREALSVKYGSWAPETKKAWSSDRLFYVYNPPIKEDEPDKKWLMRAAVSSNVEPQKTPFEKYFREKWHLRTNLLSPDSCPDNPPELDIHVNFPYFPSDLEKLSALFYYPADDDGYEPYFKVQDPQLATVVIDINHPIKKQLDIIHKELKKQKKSRSASATLMTNPRKPKDGLEHFKILLRLLDAKQLKISHAIINDTFFQTEEDTVAYDPDGEKRISRLYKEARIYRDRRYRLLPQIIKSTKNPP